MPFTMQDIGYGFLVPAVVAVVVLYVLRKMLRGNAARHFPSGIALACGFSAGYALLGLGPWQPSSHWQWLPYVAVLTAVSGPLAMAVSMSWLRVVLFVVPALIAAWVLVPDWPDLEPSRSVYLAVFATLAVLLCAATAPLASRVSDRVFTAALCMTCVSAAILLALAESLRFAQMAGVASAAMGGCAAVALFERGEGRFSGLAQSYALIVAGLMLVGRVNSFSDVPLASYLLIPATPLTLWLVAVGPMSRLSGARRALVQVILLLVPLAVAFSLVAISLLSGGENG